MIGTELLDEKVVDEHGPVQRVQRWWKGIHPERGRITRGWTGWETVEERDRVPLRHRFVVVPETSSRS